MSWVLNSARQSGEISQSRRQRIPDRRSNETKINHAQEFSKATFQIIDERTYDWLGFERKCESITAVITVIIKSI